MPMIRIPSLGQLRVPVDVHDDQLIVEGNHKEFGDTMTITHMTITNMYLAIIVEYEG